MPSGHLEIRHAQENEAESYNKHYSYERGCYYEISLLHLCIIWNHSLVVEEPSAWHENGRKRNKP